MKLMIDRFFIEKTPVQYVHGRGTYTDDFNRIVTPVLEDTFKIGEVNPDIVISPSQIPFDIMSKYTDAHYIINLHDADSIRSPILEKYFTYKYKMTFITHYKPTYNAYKDKVDIRFVPMSVDTELLPDMVQKTKESIIYFSNIYKVKKTMYEELKREYKFDTLSYSHYNGGKVELSQKECWNIVSKYEYGVGVGRSAIEMLCMGLKVIIGGKNFGGNVTVENIQEHWDTNFDSTYVGTGDNYITTLRSVFDMRNYVDDYIKIIKSIKI